MNNKSRLRLSRSSTGMNARVGVRAPGLSIAGRTSRFGFAIALTAALVGVLSCVAGVASAQTPRPLVPVPPIDVLLRNPSTTTTSPSPLLAPLAPVTRVVAAVPTTQPPSPVSPVRNAVGPVVQHVVDTVASVPAVAPLPGPPSAVSPAVPPSIATTVAPRSPNTPALGTASQAPVTGASDPVDPPATDAATSATSPADPPGVGSAASGGRAHGSARQGRAASATHHATNAHASQGQPLGLPFGALNPFAAQTPVEAGIAIAALLLVGTAVVAFGALVVAAFRARRRLAL
jgi:hypothetical protein